MVLQAANIGMLQQVYDVYSQWNSEAEPDASAEGATSAMARSLGISEDDVTACQRPTG